MPAKNKPKRLNKHRSWRVARRKKRLSELGNPKKRSRGTRPKNKGENKTETSAVTKKAVVKKTVEKKTAVNVSKE